MPKVVYSTIRDADDELHIECRFEDGQKFAGVVIDKQLNEAETLAEIVNNFLNKEKEQ